MPNDLMPFLGSLISYTLIVAIGFTLFGAVMESDNDSNKIAGGIAIWFSMYLLLFTSFDTLFKVIKTG